jgi:hypothetical protein
MLMRLVCIWGENASVGVVTQTTKAARYPCRYMRQKLFYFLFKIGKKIGAEKNIDRNTQTVTQLLNCGHGSTIVSAANNVVNSRLRNTTDAAQLVDRNVAFLAQLNDSLSDSFTDGHWISPLSKKMIPLCS